MTYTAFRTHPERMALHNEIHARPPEALNAPLAISHTVMVCDAAERDASRVHVANLLPSTSQRRSSCC